MRGDGITTFILHVSQFIIFNKTNFVKSTLIVETQLKSLYSRLGFKVFRDVATSPNFENYRKRFHHVSRKSKALQKQTIGLQFRQSIPRRVTIIHENRI